jgi:uncharacterized protein
VGTVKIKRVVIDTNVIVSGLLFGGPPGELIPLWKKGRIKPAASGDIIDEYLRVLAYPRFELEENEIEYLLYNEILPFFEIIVIEKGKPIILADPTDDKFIHCARAAKADIIISGDQHLLTLKSYDRIRIMTVSTFLKSLLDRTC